MSPLGILTVISLCVLAIVAIAAVITTTVVFIRDWRQDAQAGKHATPQDDIGWGERPPEIASEPPTEIMAAPIAPPWAPAAAVESPPLPPPPVHHDEFGPVQWYDDGPPDPAAADLPPAAPHPSPPVTILVLLAAALRARHRQAEHARAQARDTCQRATAIGAAITAGQRARDEARAAEVAETRPWADDTGTFSRETLLAALRAEDPLDVPDGPLSIPLEVLHETDAGV